jgi:hypothetical protein
MERLSAYATSNYHARMITRRARNTFASPQAVQAGDALGYWGWWGYLSGSFSEGAGMTVDVGSVGSYVHASMSFYVGPAGVGTRSLKLTHNGYTVVHTPGWTDDTQLANSNLTFYLASNTSLRIRVRGTDGVVREGTITLT